MSLTLDEQIIRSKQRTAKLEQQKRVQLRKEREEKKKIDQRRNYIIGELVTKYFPALTSLEPGTKAENDIIFQPLENFLSILSTEQKLIDHLKEKAVSTASLTAEKGGILCSSSPQCVSGHQQVTDSATAQKEVNNHGKLSYGA